LASIVDELLAREASILPGYEGLNAAFAGDAVWHRESPEAERDFVGRVFAEAADQGYRTVTFSGQFDVEKGRATERYRRRSD
jgi:hypothetical protein